VNRPDLDEPVVSIIIPAFNADRYIERAVESVLGQTYRPLEVIVVDDGSTDMTRARIHRFRDPRLIYVYQDNAGQGSARNNGIRRSRGTYLAFLDADDQYLPSKIETEVEFLRQHPRYRIVYCNALHRFGHGRAGLYKRRLGHRSGHLLPELLRSSHINTNTVLVARTVLARCGGFVETRYYPEEWDLWLRIALSGFEFGYIDEDLVVVDVREGSNTTMEIQPILKRHALEMFERLLPAPVEIDGVTYSKDRTVKDLRLKLAGAYLANGQRREFLDAFRAATDRRFWGYPLGCLLMTVPRSVVGHAWRVRQQWWGSVSVGEQ
jgi:glycosyltransferase involved in cell wall biosynthesis